MRQRRQQTRGWPREAVSASPTCNSALTSFHSPFHQLVPAACFLGTGRQNLEYEILAFQFQPRAPWEPEERQKEKKNDRGPELRKREDSLPLFLHRLL